MENKLIAIIGMAGKFPKAESLEAFWANLLEGRDCITRQTPLITEGEGYSCINAYGKMENIYEFDAPFFGIGSGDADLMEPQERLLLECGYLALEDAGYATDNYGGKIGIICGAQENAYYLKNRFENKRGNRLTVEAEKFLNSGTSLAGRISFKLNLTGPSIIVNTACSTSLTAVQMAADFIRSGSADLMLAGGSNVSIQQENYVHIEGMSASDGVVRPFDRQSTGLVPGSGLGLVVLKEYDRALQDGDNIYAVIEGGAIGNDGNRKIGYTAPSVQGECDVIQGALEASGLAGDDIDYIETHGTATVLGDCIEVRALNKAFASVHASDTKIPIGSLKGNYGHLNSAAGIAGLLKASLILKHQIIPPSIHNETENDELRENQKFYVSQETMDARGRLRGLKHVGISSFGIGGMNTHVILGVPGVRAQEESVRDAELMVYSAKEAVSLEEYKKALMPFVNHAESLGRASYTSLVRRQVYDQRAYLVCRDGTAQEQVHCNGKRVMLQVSGCGDVQAHIAELSEALPGFGEAYRAFLEQENEGCSEERMRRSYLAALEVILQNMKFHCKTLNERESQAIGSGDAEFCVYFGDQLDMPQAGAEDICLMTLDRKGLIWFDLLQFMGCAWSKDYPAVWENLFFENQRQTCSIPGYCFHRTTHKIEFDCDLLEDEAKRPDAVADYSEICTFFQEELEDDGINVQARIEDLDIDSMMLLVIKSKISEKYHCTFTIQDFYTCDTIADVIALIRGRGQQGAQMAAVEQYGHIDDLFDGL